MRSQIFTATEQSVVPLSLPEHTAAAGAQHGLLAAPGVRGVLCWQLIWLCCLLQVGPCEWPAPYLLQVGVAGGCIHSMCSNSHATLLHQLLAAACASH